MALVLDSGARRKMIYSSLWDQLVEELRSCKGVDGKGVPDELLRKFESRPGEPDASDLYRIDAAALEYLSDHELRLRIIAYRGLLEHLLSQDAYAAMIPQFSADMSNRQHLLDEARALASRMYRRYVLVPAVEGLRADIARKLFFSVAIFWVLAAWLRYLFPETLLDGYALAVMAGAAGSTVSTTVRLYQVDPRHEPLLTWMNLERGKPSLWVAPVLGAVFATVLVLLVRAHLLTGALFPDFSDDAWTGLQPKYATCEADTKACAALSGDMAKLLIWAFVAGWAERFVPDVLNKLGVVAPRYLHEDLRSEPEQPPPRKPNEKADKAGAAKPPETEFGGPVG